MKDIVMRVGSARKWLIPIGMVLGLVFVSSDLSRAAIQAGNVTRVSIASDGTQGNYSSFTPAISTDGRFVVFSSYAFNLVDGDTNNEVDVFLHDRDTGLTERVSIASDGSQAIGSSWEPAISANGRFVAFQSIANNLASTDTYIGEDIYVHDRQTGQTELVSISSEGNQGEGDSYRPSISADGRYVAFESYSHLTSNETDWWNVYLRDRQTGQTELISKSFDGAPQTGPSDDPCISPDGRYVAFSSGASNLVNGDTNEHGDIFVQDRQTGLMELVSVASDGTQGNDYSRHPSISAGGRFVAFESYASNFVNGDSNGFKDVFVHDRQTGQTQRVSISSDGAQANYWAEAPAISANGRFLVFISDADNLVSGDTNIDVDIFLHDLQTGQTERISVTSDGAQGDGNSFGPSVSATGRFVAYFTNSTNLVEGDTNGTNDVFVYENSSDFFYGLKVYLPFGINTVSRP